MGSPDGAGAPGSRMDKRQKIQFDMEQKTKEIRTLSKDDLKDHERGEHGASLMSDEEGPRKTAKANLEGAELIDEEFLEGLRRDRTKIPELMQKLGETRQNVSLVARTKDGKITRMLIEKQEGKYKEVSEGEGVNQTKKEKGHLQEDDLLLFEKGAKTQA